MPNQLINRIPWDTLSDIAVVILVIIIIAGGCISIYLRSRKKPDMDAKVGSKNKRVSIDQSGKARAKVGNGNEDVKITARGKR